MAGSAIIGQPPNTKNDYYIVNALIRLFHLKIDPSKGISFGRIPPNLRDDNSRGSGLLVGYAICITLIIFITGSRLLIRGLHQKLKWGWDDWFIIPAALCTIAWLIKSVVVVLHGGGGRHIYFLSYEEYNIFYKAGAIGLVLYIPATVCVKVSIALFVRRFTGLQSKTWLWINNVFLFLLFAQFVAFVFHNSFSCHPAAGYFDLIKAGKYKTPMKCSPYVLPGQVRVYFNVVFDFALLTTPVIILWKVQMPMAKKLRVCAIFALGIIPCVASVMSIVVSVTETKDVTYRWTTVQGWLMVDLFFGLFVASAPILYPQLPASWRVMSTAVRNQLSSNKSQSQRIPDERSVERSGDDEIVRLNKIHRRDDVELAFSFADGESGKKGLLDDQHAWGENSVQVPGRAFHYSTSGAGKTEAITSPSSGVHSEKGSVS